MITYSIYTDDTQPNITLCGATKLVAEKIRRQAGDRKENPLDPLFSLNIGLYRTAAGVFIINTCIDDYTADEDYYTDEMDHYTEYDEYYTEINDAVIGCDRSSAHAALDAAHAALAGVLHKIGESLTAEETGKIAAFRTQIDKIDWSTMRSADAVTLHMPARDMSITHIDPHISSAGYFGDGPWQEMWWRIFDDTTRDELRAIGGIEEEDDPGVFKLNAYQILEHDAAEIYVTDKGDIIVDTDDLLDPAVLPAATATVADLIAIVGHGRRAEDAYNWISVPSEIHMK